MDLRFRPEISLFLDKSTEEPLPDAVQSIVSMATARKPDRLVRGTLIGISRWEIEDNSSVNPDMKGAVRFESEEGKAWLRKDGVFQVISSP